MPDGADALIAGLSFAALLQTSVFYFQRWRPRLRRRRRLQRRTALDQAALVEEFAASGAAGPTIAPNLGTIGSHLHVQPGLLRPGDKLTDLYDLSAFAIQRVGLLDSDVFRCEAAIRNGVEAGGQACVVEDLVEQCPLAALLRMLDDSGCPRVKRGLRACNRLTSWSVNSVSQGTWSYDWVGNWTNAGHSVDTKVDWLNSTPSLSYSHGARGQMTQMGSEGVLRTSPEQLRITKWIDFPALE